MQSRFIKTYGILFMLALLASLAVTACSSSDRNESSAAKAATIAFTVDLPSTSAKTLSETTQILVYLMQDTKAVAGTDQIFVPSEMVEPYVETTKGVGIYENHPQQGEQDRYVTFNYVTDKVDDGENYTIVLEYYGEDENDVIATAFAPQLGGFESGGEPIKVSTADKEKVIVVYDGDTIVTPNPINANVGDDPIELTVKYKWTDADVEDLTVDAGTTYEVIPDETGKNIGTVEKGSEKVYFNAGTDAGKGEVHIVHKYGEYNVPVEVVTPPEPKYTLVADFSNISLAAFDKDTITGAKFDNDAATVAEHKATSNAPLSAGYHNVTLIAGEEEYTTTAKVEFWPKSETDTEIVVTLQDDNFPCHYDLIVNYSGIEDAFDNTKVESVVGATICFLQALFGESCKTFLEKVATPNWRKLQRRFVACNSLSWALL